MNDSIKDVQSYAYMLDDGQRVNVTLCEMDRPSGKHHGGSNMAVTIEVDGKSRLVADDHFSTIADFGPGEWMIHAVVDCLSRHVAYWAKWQEFQLCISEEHQPERLEIPGATVPVHRSNAAVRHIPQLTDEQAWWWITDPEWDGCSAEDNGQAVLEYLAKVGSERFSEFSTANADRLRQLEEDRQLDKILKGLTEGLDSD